MPRVPTFDNFEVQQATLPEVRVSGSLTPEAASAPGRQLYNLGKGVQSVGDALGAIELDAQQRANQLRADDATNKLLEFEQYATHDKQAGFTNIRGVDALQRQSGKPLADEYGELYRKKVDEIASGLGNDVQRQAFMREANRRQVNFQGNIIQHEGQQFREYSLSTREGTIKTRMDDIALNYTDPEKVQEGVRSIQAAVYDQAKLLGKSAEWADARAKEMTSNAHKLAINTALEKNNVAFADEYLKKHAGEMNADDILRAQGVLTKNMDTRLAVEVATTTIQKTLPKMTTSDSDRAFNILIGTESRGKQFDSNGEPLTSSAGAIGIAQVMPGTAPIAAKMAGLPYDENRYRTDPEYNRALGKAYFERQLQDFNGNLPQAYAAYNAGPGATRKALDRAEREGGNWLAYLPKETQDYVTKNMREFGTGGGSFQRPSLMEAKNEVREKLGTQNPERLKVALAEVERQYDEVSKAIKQREDETVANAMRGVMANGGRYSDLPPSLRAAIPPGEVDKVINFAQKISKGDDTTSLYLYNKLTSNPDALKTLSDDEFYKLRAELSESDFKHFSNERAKLRGVNTGLGAADDLNSGAISSTLNDRLRMLKIDPTPKDGSGDAVRVGAIRKFVNESVLATQRANGKKMSDGEVQAHIDWLFARNAVYSGIFTDSSGPMLGMKAGDIPSEQKSAIKDAFKKRGVDSPTDADLLGAYWHQLTLRPKKTAGATGAW